MNVLLHKTEIFGQIQHLLLFFDDQIKFGGDLHLGVAGDGHEDADDNMVKFAVDDIHKNNEDPQKEGDDAAVITIITDAFDGLEITQFHEGYYNTAPQDGYRGIGIPRAVQFRTILTVFLPTNRPAL